MFPRPVEIAWRVFQRKRDPRALAVVFDRTAPELLVLARHLASPGTDAEDLVQATFVTAIEDAKSHRPGERVVPWLVGILTNHARAARRRARRPLDTGRLPHPIADATADVATSELNAELRAAIDRLPEAYRPVLRLVCEHGLAANEIARTLERPAGTVRAQVTRGIDLLRRYLPASLAGSAAVMAATGRGLAAVRSEVLARCGGTATGFLSAVTLGGLAVLQHKVLAALAAALLVTVGWFVIDPSPGVGTVAAGPSPTSPAPAAAPLAGAPPAPATAGDTPSRTAANDPAAAPTGPAPVPATTGELIVRVVADGVPCPGIGVAVGPLDDLQSLGRDLVHRPTDARGEIRFAALAPGQWAIDVDRTGTASVAETTAGGSVQRTVELPAGVTVRGVVRDASGAPSAGASIALIGNRAAHVGVATSDAAGRFTVAHLAPGLELQARAAGRQPSLAAPVRGAAGTEVEVELVLGNAARTIAGRVVDPDGRPVAEAVVAVLPAAAAIVDPAARDRQQHRASWLRTDREGAFRCDEATDGSTLVFADASNRGLAPAWVEIDASQDGAFADLRLQRGARLEGTVRRGGEPMPFAEVVLWPLEEPRVGYLLNLFGFRRATTGADGSFVLAGLLPVRQSGRAMLGNGTLLEQRELALHDGETTIWNVDPKGHDRLAILVEGDASLDDLRLVAIITNTTLRNGEMPQIVPIGQERIGKHTGPRSEAVDVVLTHMPGGSSLLQLAAVRNVVPSERSVKFVLSPRDVPSRSIRGRLVDAQAAPLAGETVAAMKASADGLVVRVEVRTGADGSFAVGPLPAGDYTLLAGSLREARPVGTAVLTPDRDEDVGDLRRH